MPGNLSKPKEACLRDGIPGYPFLDGHGRSGELFLQLLAGEIQRGAWFYLPAILDNRGSRPCIVEYLSAAYVAVYSSSAHSRIRKWGADGVLLACDIRKVIEIIHNEPALAGIALDPDTEPLFIRRSELDACLPPLSENAAGEAQKE